MVPFLIVVYFLLFRFVNVVRAYFRRLVTAVLFIVSYLLCLGQVFGVLLCTAQVFDSCVICATPFSTSGTTIGELGTEVYGARRVSTATQTNSGRVMDSRTRPPITIGKYIENGTSGGA